MYTLMFTHWIIDFYIYAPCPPPSVEQLAMVLIGSDQQYIFIDDRLTGSSYNKCSERSC